MTDNMQEEFTEDFAGQIALECRKLETAVRVGLEGYDNTHLLLGKQRWYSIGLEDNDADKEKDAGNKRNVLLRIIDSIVAFIKAVGKKIAEWYRACKAAILKFFGKEAVPPEQVSKRFDVLVEGLTEKQVNEITKSVSKETKNALVEIFSKEYSDAFHALYAECKEIRGKADSVDKFSANYEFFTQFRVKSHELKDIAKKNTIYEDELLLKKLLTGKGYAEKVKDIMAIFSEISAVHDANTDKLEQLLKKIPDDQLERVEGSNPDSKRRDAVNLISEVLKIEADLVLKVNSHMQAISMLMTHVMKYRFKSVVIIKM